jgi:hypothetical protein
MRIPVHVVSGPPGAARGALIARLCTERPDWLGLVETIPPGATSNVRALSAGCPCCIGRVVLQITLARALRESRAVRAFVELADQEHATGLERVLGESPLGLSVVRSRPIALPADAELTAAHLAG